MDQLTVERCLVYGAISVTFRAGFDGGVDTSNGGAESLFGISPMENLSRSNDGMRHPSIGPVGV